MMKRVFSQDSNLSQDYNNILQRPSTAAVGPTMTQATGTFRKPLASNSILQYNAQARSFNRHFLYNKQSYQNSGALVNVTAVVDTNNQNQLRSNIAQLNPTSDRFTARRIDNSFERSNGEGPSNLPLPRDI